ncbi:MAG: hypothetical protein M3081_18965 [Gemmatimonadota bacterium]|nr:hypothetical protein [Gemmatimonadota bacterium]
MTNPTTPLSDDALRRFLDAFAEIHPANYEAIVRAASMDPEYEHASTLVRSLAADGAEGIRASESFPFEIARVTRAARERTNTTELGEGARVESIAISAMLALLLRRAMHEGTLARAFDVTYRPFAGVIPLGTIVLSGDASPAPAEFE